MTDEMGDIAKLVSERVAALCCNRTDASDRQKLRNEARHIYDLRSRLVHGSISPSDPEVETDVWLAARLSEETLLNALLALGADGLNTESISTKRLARWYGRIVESVDDVEAAVALRPDVSDALTMPSDSAKLGGGEDINGMMP